MSEADDYHAGLPPTGQHVAELSKVLQADQNKDWAAKLLSGDKEAVAQFNALASRITGVNADSNVPPPNPEIVSTASESHLTPGMTPREQLNDIEAWRSQGYSDITVGELHDENRSYTAQEHAGAKAFVEQWSRDPEFQRRLFSGDFAAKRQVLAAATILSGNVKAA